METRNISFIRSRISRILRIFGLSRGDQWSLLRRPLGRKPRTPWPSLISHRTHPSSLTTNHTRIFFLLTRIFHEYYLYSGENEIFNSGENGRVSRFNSGDLAGKLKPPIGFRKYALRAENNCLSKPKAWKAGKTTDGGEVTEGNKPPLNKAPNKWVLKARKTLVAPSGLPCVWNPITGG